MNYFVGETNGVDVNPGDEPGFQRAKDCLGPKIDWVSFAKISMCNMDKNKLIFVVERQKHTKHLLSVCLDYLFFEGFNGGQWKDEEISNVFKN